MELLYERGTPAFRSEWRSIEATLDLVTPIPFVGDWEHAYLALPKHIASPAGGPLALRPAEVPVPVVRSTPLSSGLLQDQPQARIKTLDENEITSQAIGPGMPVRQAARLAPRLAAGMLGAYNRYLLTYCSVDPRRLKAVITVHGLEPHWSAHEIGDLADDPALGGVSVYFPVKVALDERNFAPIWAALSQGGHTVFHRPGFSADIWDNVHLLSYLVRSGLLDRYPGVRLVMIHAEDALTALVRAGTASSGPEAEARTAALRLVREGRLRFSLPFGVDPPGKLANELGGDALLAHSDFPFRELPAESNGAGGGARMAQEAEGLAGSR